MSRKRQKDVSKETVGSRTALSGAVIKLGMYAVYCFVFLTKKINRLLFGALRKFASGTASVLIGAVRKLSGAWKKLFAPFASPDRSSEKRNLSGDSRTDMTLGSIRTTGFRQFVSRAAGICVPAAALIMFAVVLTNANRNDGRISDHNFTARYEEITGEVTEPSAEPAVSEEAVVSGDITGDADPEDGPDYTDATGVYCDGSLIGVLTDTAELEKFISMQLSEAKSRTDIADAELRSSIEYRKGRFPESSVTDTDTVISSISSETAEKRYTVEEGDAPSLIAEANGISLDDLIHMNPVLSENPDSFNAGMELVIAPAGRQVPLVVTREVQQYTVIPYTVKTENNDQLSSGESELLTAGENGRGVSVIRVKYDGDREISREVVSTQVEYEPVDEVISVGTAADQTEASPEDDGTVIDGNGRFMWPVNGGTVLRSDSSGLVVDVPDGRGVYAAADGKVLSAGWNRSLGYFAVTDNGEGYVTICSHMDRVYVTAGQTVKRGELTGETGPGAGGRSEGFLFEVKLNGSGQNPSDFIRVNADKSETDTSDDTSTEDEYADYSYYYDDYDYDYGYDDYYYDYY